MNKRTMLIAGASLGVACVSVVGGALISSSAMAAPIDGVTGTLTIVRAVDGQDPITCTFDDVALPAVPAFDPSVGSGDDAHPSTDADGPSVVFGSEAGGVSDVPDGGAVIGVSQSVHVVGGPGAGGDAGELPPPPDGAVVFSSDDARVGTAEECAAIRTEMDDMPGPGQPGGPVTASATAAPTESTTP